MTKFNIETNASLEANYTAGLLPQRTQKDLFYSDSSCRSDLHLFKLSSENRRILRKTQEYKYTIQALSDFDYSPQIQKLIRSWVKELNWDFPTSSIRTVFSNHIFNTVITWTDQNNKVIAYAVCLFTNSISHIAYLFYDPAISHQDILIRIVLQFVIDSYDRKLDYAYLGRFAPTVGYYKRNMPGFEFFIEGHWVSDLSKI